MQAGGRIGGKGSAGPDEGAVRMRRRRERGGGAEGCDSIISATTTRERDDEDAGRRVFDDC